MSLAQCMTLIFSPRSTYYIVHCSECRGIMSQYAVDVEFCICRDRSTLFQRDRFRSGESGSGKRYEKLAPRSGRLIAFGSWSRLLSPTCQVHSSTPTCQSTWMRSFVSTTTLGWVFFSWIVLPITGVVFRCTRRGLDAVFTYGVY